MNENLLDQHALFRLFLLFYSLSSKRLEHGKYPKLIFINELYNLAEVSPNQVQFFEFRGSKKTAFPAVFFCFYPARPLRINSSDTRMGVSVSKQVKKPSSDTVTGFFVPGLKDLSEPYSSARF